MIHGTVYLKLGEAIEKELQFILVIYSENCDAYKRNKYVMLNRLCSHSCPYGQMKREEGYTKAARKCGDLIRKKKDEYGDIAHSKGDLKFVCYIGDYVFFPYIQK